MKKEEEEKKKKRILSARFNFYMIFKSNFIDILTKQIQTHDF